MIDFEFLDKINNVTIIKRKELITYDELRELKKYRIEIVKPFIEQVLNTNDYNVSKFILEEKCSECGQIDILELSKTKLLEHLNSKYKHICDNCKARIKIKKEKETIKDVRVYREQLLKAEKEATDDFIRQYLDPNRTFIKEIKNKYSAMIYPRSYNIANKDEIADYIKEMDYYDFLQTPYWDAVRSKKLYDANFKCQLCGKSGVKLNVHHNSYEHHGYEAEYFKEDLIVLCNECHEKFHDKE